MSTNSQVTSGIILAAGLSRRLNSILKGGTKVTYNINSLPLILYPFLSLYAVGVRDFCIVVNRINYGDVLSVFENLKLDDVHVELVLNPKPSLGNGYSLLLGNRCIEDDYFFLSMADHIYSPSVPETLLEEFKYGIDVVVGGDSKPRFVDIKEATKIHFEKGIIKAMGKNIRKYSHVDIGVFIMSKEILKLYEIDGITRSLSVTQIIRSANRAGYKVSIADVRGGYWTEIDTPQDVKELLFGRRNRVLDAFQREFSLYISQEISEIYESQTL